MPTLCSIHLHAPYTFKVQLHDSTKGDLLTGGMIHRWRSGASMCTRLHLHSKVTCAAAEFARYNN